MQLSVGNITLDLSYPKVMGILNVTPDSFYDGGYYTQVNKAVLHAHHLLSAGANIIDVGGESTRPGATKVSVEEEIARVMPIVEALTQRFEAWISIDTSKAAVIKAAAEAGVHMINDVRALQEPGALEAAVKSDLPVCLMHMLGQQCTMQYATTNYHDLINSVKKFFKYHIERCNSAGIQNQKLILDPGFGFGKKVTHNYQLLARLSEFHCFGMPLLVGMSRKSMIGDILNKSPNESIIGSVACAVIAAMQGVHILRVHDVKETVEAICVVKETLAAKGLCRHE